MVKGPCESGAPRVVENNGEVGSHRASRDERRKINDHGIWYDLREGQQDGLIHTVVKVKLVLSLMGPNLIIARGLVKFVSVAARLVCPVLLGSL